MLLLKRLISFIKRFVKQLVDFFIHWVNLLILKRYFFLKSWLYLKKKNAVEVNDVQHSSKHLPLCSTITHFRVNHQIKLLTFLNNSAFYKTQPFLFLKNSWTHSKNTNENKAAPICSSTHTTKTTATSTSYLPKSSHTAESTAMESMSASLLRLDSVYRELKQTSWASGLKVCFFYSRYVS